MVRNQIVPSDLVQITLFTIERSRHRLQVIHDRFGRIRELLAPLPLAEPSIQLIGVVLEEITFLVEQLERLEHCWSTLESRAAPPDSSSGSD